MLSGSIPDSKLAEISSAGKVKGSAVQLATNTAIEVSTGLGLQLKSSIGDTGLTLTSESGVQKLSVDAIQSHITSIGQDGQVLTVSSNIMGKDASFVDIYVENQKEELSFLSYDQQRMFYAANQARQDDNAYSGYEGGGMVSQVEGLAEDLSPMRDRSENKGVTEVIEYDKAVYGEILAALEGSDTKQGRLVYETMTLEQKENMLKTARFSAYEKTSLKNK